jgi:hypothetical protein
MASPFDAVLKLAEIISDDYGLAETSQVFSLA